MLLARATRAQPSLPQWHVPTLGGCRPTKFEPNPFSWLDLQPWLKVSSCKGLRDRTGPEIAPSSFRRSGGSGALNQSTPVPIGLATLAPEAQVLGQTDKHRPAYFFSDTLDKIFEHKAFKAKALKPFYSAILNTQKTLICNFSAWASPTEG